MDISFEQFKEEVKNLEEKMKKFFEKKETPERKLIIDGIVNEKQYYESKIKIMWILKEPYDDKNNGGGDYYITKDVIKSIIEKSNKGASGTWLPIMYASYGILNNFMKFEEMKKIKDKELIKFVLNKIAFINVQKLPGKTTTSSINLKNYYSDNKEILLNQISTYLPNIIIGGGTLSLFKKDLEIKEEDELSFGHFHKNKLLYIKTYHPSQRSLRKSEYIDKIIIRAEQHKDIYS